MMGSAAAAEMVATFFLCPLEVGACGARPPASPCRTLSTSLSPIPQPLHPYRRAQVVKLRMQTDALSRSAGVVGTIRHTVAREGVSALWKGYVPIALRQVPYSSTKLVCFELCAAALLGGLARITSDEEERQRHGASAGSRKMMERLGETDVRWSRAASSSSSSSSHHDIRWSRAGGRCAQQQKERRKVVRLCGDLELTATPRPDRSCCVCALLSSSRRA